MHSYCLLEDTASLCDTGQMARRRFSKPSVKTVSGDPATAVRQFLVQLHDRQDGHGVDWRVIAETLFKASFDVLDKLPEDQKRTVALRVHEGSYRRVTGEAVGGSGEGAKGVSRSSGSSNAGRAPARAPKPPR
jgi:hypothetical protein